MTIVGSIPIWGKKIFINFFALVTRQITALSCASQHAMPRAAEVGGRIVLRLGSPVHPLQEKKY